MRCFFATLFWLVVAPAFGQAPLTVTAALDEAIASNPELLALRKEPTADRLQALLRASEIMAEVRAAHAELVIAREALTLHDGQAPMMAEMANAAALQRGPVDMARHDPPQMVVDIARLAAARVTAREQVRIAELRLNAVLGRRVDAPIETLAAREAASLPENAVELALMRDPRLAAASDARRDALALDVRRRVLEALARVEGARERAMIVTTTVLPRVALAFDSARAAYTANQGEFLDMVDAHHRQMQARVESAAAAAVLERALVALDVAIGEPPQRLARAVGSDRPEK